MGITLDIIADKVFSDVGGGYSKHEVDDFLNDILEEMENREDETRSLKEQVASLIEQRDAARAEAQKAPKSVYEAPTQTSRHSAESFELVLSKAKSVYEEIVGDADRKAAEILAKANADAANIRSDAESKISDLTARFESVRKQAATYYDALKKLEDQQSGALASLKDLID